MRSPTRQRGFTLLELMIVIVIILVVAAMAIPAVMTAMYSVRLRSAASEFSGLLQSARMRSIRDNRVYPITCTPNPNQFPNGTCSTVYVDLSGTGAGAYQAAGPGGQPAAVIQLPGTVRFSMAGYPAVPASLLGGNFAPLVNQQIYFSTRGLPCSSAGGAGGVCTNAGFVFYLTDQRPLGANGYAAIVVTPAGRFRVFSYSPGSGWFQS